MKFRWEIFQLLKDDAYDYVICCVMVDILVMLRDGVSPRDAA